MILHVQGVPAVRPQILLPTRKHLFEPQQIEPFRTRLAFAHVMLQLEDHVQIAVLFSPMHRFFAGNAACFADCHDRVGIKNFLQLLHIDFDPRDVHERSPRIIGDSEIPGFFLDMADCIQTEAVDPQVQPPADHPVDFFPHLRIFPVQIGLFRRKDMEIGLARVVIVSPGRAAEEALPSVRQLVFRGIRPQIIVAVRIVFAFFCFQKPRMLVARMVHHQIHDDFDACSMGFAQQFLEIGHRPEIGMDVLIIGNVIAVVDIRRSVNRVQPDEIHAQ